MVIVVGTNHKYSPIQTREKLFFSKKMFKEALRSLCGYPGINATVILSTCNRVELYADVLDTDIGIRALKRFLCDYHHQELSRIESYLYTYIGKEAVLHLFCVASGLDSQILGENQILEQVRFVYEEAKESGTTNDFLSSIFNKAIDTGIKLRKDTEISKGDVSIASITVSLIKGKFASLKNKKILIIGVGKISELLIRDLKNEEIKVVFIANRTYERATELARCIGAEVLRFEEMKRRLIETDIIISATSSSHLILKKEDILEAIKHKSSAINHQPLLVIDLAVPRDVDPEIKHISGVELYCLDDLTHVVEKNLEARRKEMPKALEIIKEEVENLCLDEHLELEPEPALLL